MSQKQTMEWMDKYNKQIREEEIRLLKSKPFVAEAPFNS
jgi:hypothetical protein